MNMFLGFDPGGEGNFGWAVCAEAADKLRVLRTGNADDAQNAVNRTLEIISEGDNLLGAGIDAPMFWVTQGGRKADDTVRKEITERGAPAAAGTVQHFNSLRGACLIQGLMAARLLRQKYRNIPITEAHPKALLWLLGCAKKDHKPDQVRLKDLNDIEIEKNSSAWDSKEDADHKRDAVLGALAAQAMFRKNPGWEDLLVKENSKETILAVEKPLGYWMPRVIR